MFLTHLSYLVSSAAELVSNNVNLIGNPLIPMEKFLQTSVQYGAGPKMLIKSFPCVSNYAGVSSPLLS